MTYQDMNQGKTHQRQAETRAENIAKMKFQIQYWYVFLFFRDDYQLCLVGKQPVVYSMAHDAAFRSEIIFLWGSKRLLGPDAYVHVTHC